MINMERGAIQFRRIMEDSKKRSDAISMKYTESPEDLMRKRKSRNCVSSIAKMVRLAEDGRKLERVFVFADTETKYEEYRRELEPLGIPVVNIAHAHTEN